MKGDKVLLSEIRRGLDRLDREDLRLQRLMADYFGIHPKHIYYPRSDFLGRYTKPDDVILDLGSAGGVVSCRIADRVKRIVSVDLCPVHPDCHAPNLEHIQMDVMEYLSVRQDQSNLAFLSHILEHFPDPLKLLGLLECLSVVVIVPHMENWETQARRALGVNWLMDDGHHLLYTRELLAEHLNQSGFSEIELLEFDGDNGIRAVAHRAGSTRSR